ncbi:MAG TPA: hypothetical protein VJU18_09790 [Vicinamibacteria bacterium]|nr:hypothetical protein [Vicinamibacteria bacterium]
MIAPFALLALRLAFQEPANNPPDITDETATCAKPGSRPRVCARVFDDRGVAKVRVLFRARGAKPYFAAEMTFDGARYCVSLPAPQKGTKSIEYYLEAVDSDFEPSRAVAKSLPIAGKCSTPAPAEPAAPTAVTPVQPGEKLGGFDPATFSLPAPAGPSKGN